MIPDELPFVPGVLPDDSAESLDLAMHEAHELLPWVPGTAVTIYHWHPIEGYERLRELGFTEESIAAVMALVAERGPRARVTLACRKPHEWGAA